MPGIFSCRARSQSGRSRLRTILTIASVFALAAVILVVGVTVQSFLMVPKLFKLNKQCQEEGYFMAEFEFKLLGFAYQLDKGRYVDAITGIRRLHDRLKTRKGLVKVPRFADKREELEFYLGLQNPRTGAFMDDSFPYCTWDGPTQNVLEHLELLARATGQPLRLRYRLKYLDQINTPQRLTAYLDDVSHIGWIASKFPQTSFHFARELFGYSEESTLLEKHGLYSFTPEWKHAMRQWFHDFQDPDTGLWGPRSRWTGKPIKLDVHNSTSIVKALLDENGNDRYPSMPVRYKRQIFASTLEVMAEPMPPEGDLDEWHEWALSMGKSIDMLTRYVWNDGSEEQRAAAADLIEKYVRVKFERYFVPNDGAFAYYPGSEHATIDGTGGGIHVFIELGAFSAERHKRLWGGARDTCTDLGRVSIPALTEGDLALVTKAPKVNSVRFYVRPPEQADYITGVAGVFYPRATPVLDGMELVPRVRQWLETTHQRMGNWVSREELLARLSKTGITPVPVSRADIPIARLNKLLSENKTLTVIGFDVLQVPRARVAFQAQ